MADERGEPRPERLRDRPVRLPDRPDRLTGSLLRWYRRAARTLPWRGSLDPYAIWVSEVMLQQTRVETVLRYYAPFLRAFPTVGALASAELPAVLARWSGLGYYARARAMHAAARTIASRGAFPDAFEELRELPGFGAYTAAAVAAIAFGRPEPAIDGNAVRVLARLCGLRERRPAAEKTLRELARPLVAAGPPSEVNQAVMELGSQVCTRTAPACLHCPWRIPCRARAFGLQGEIPASRPRLARRPLTWAAAVCLDGRGRLLFARRPPAGLFGGLWELPGGEVAQGIGTADMARDLSAALRRSLGAHLTIAEPMAEVTQRLTHRDLRVLAFAARGVPPRPRRLPPGGYLETCLAGRAAAIDLGLSSVTRKLLAVLPPPASMTQIC